jgi:hypothetical protein
MVWVLLAWVFSKVVVDNNSTTALSTVTLLMQIQL